MLDLKLVLFVVLVGISGWVIWWERRRGRSAPPSNSTTDHDRAEPLRQYHTFIGQLSHELRTPLTAVLAHAAVARNPDTDDAVRRTSLAMLEAEAQRMSRLVRDLLELYRLETTEMPLVPTNVALVAEDALSILLPLAEARGITMSFEFADALPRVLAQPDRLKQVWLNVVANAVQSCRPDDTIHVRLVAQKDGVLCCVHDSGPGIAAADLPHVTERLYRGRTDHEGSGLGLALVSEILAQFGATLQIESSTVAPSGTTVTWVLSYAT